MTSQTKLESIFIIPDGRNERTFQYDEQLPSLPLPDLQKTLSRYLESIKPFVTTGEYDNTVQILQKFERGDGRRLHEILLRKARTERNWVEKWWEDLAYLSNRTPLLPYCSMDGIQPIEVFDWKYEGVEDQLHHSCLYVYHLIRYWKLLREERMRPSTSADGKTKFSMFQFRRLFNTVRIPGQHVDQLKCYFKTAVEGVCSTEIIVLCNGRIFAVNVVDDNGEPITALEIKKYFREIREISVKNGGKNVGILTCDDRTNWAKNRQHILSLSNKNRKIIQRIEESMFVVVLDLATPKTASEVSSENLCGDFNNRWTDKSVNCVYYSSGTCGGVCDHTAFDGLVSVTAFYFTYTALEGTGGKWQGTSVIRQLPPCQELDIELDNYLQTEIRRLQVECVEQKSEVIMTRRSFRKYGKKTIQKYKLHPDAYVQQALQLAYYRLHGRPAPCYETATTRGYYNGRTETVRSCTEECLDWVVCMLDVNRSSREKRLLLEKTINKHEELMREARDNSGCDRHMFGLYCVSVEQGLPTPDLFTDPSYVKSGGGGNYVLSTSLVGYSPMGGGVAPMCTDGYGIFYNMMPSTIYATITANSKSKETSAHKFFEAFSQSLLDMKEMLDDSTNISKL